MDFDEGEEKEEELEGDCAVGVTEEVLAFARNIAMHPETWLDFPLDEEEDLGGMYTKFYTVCIFQCITQFSLVNFINVETLVQLKCTLHYSPSNCWVNLRISLFCYWRFIC